MMTKKDYERAVAIIQQTTGDRDRSYTVVLYGAFRDFFRGDNPRFDEARFTSAVKKATGVSFNK